jgi:hypothetical protein
MSIENLYYENIEEYHENPRLLAGFQFSVYKMEDNTDELLYQAGVVEDGQVFEILPKWLREYAEFVARKIYEGRGWAIDFEMNDDVGEDIIAVAQNGSTFRFALIEEEWMDLLLDRVYEETR